MKVFVWESVDNLTTHWHCRGGLVVFADTEERAREIASVVVAELRADEAPSEVRDASGSEDVFVFPDAGCC